MEQELASFRQQARARPKDAVAQHNLGVMLGRAGHLDEALQQFDLALRLNPGYVPAHYARGRALMRQGKYEPAIAALQKATAAPEYAADAWLALGDAYRLRQRVSEATDAYERHLALLPNSAAGYVNGGQMLLGGAPAAALALLDRGIAALPKLAVLHGLRGQALLKLRRYADAIAALRQALTLAPDLWAARGDLLRACREVADWDGEVEIVAAFREALPGFTGKDQLPLGVQNALFFAFTGPELRRFATLEAGWRSRGVTPLPPVRPEARNADRPLRIGYLSPDFHNHPMMHLISDIFAAHDRSKVSVTAYSITQVAEDEWTWRVRNGADRFIDLNGLDDAAAAARIREDGIDVMLDIAVYTQFCRPGILARRPAPVQMAWVGTPASPSSPWIDYMIVDAVVAPPDQRDHFGEALIHLPKTYLPNMAWATPETMPSRAEAGLPENAIVFSCMNGHRKIDRDSFAAWMRILQGVPDSLIWLLDLPEETVAALRRHAAAAGIAPERLHVAPWTDRAGHLRRLHCADLSLDTLIYGAHTTAADALRCGLPLLTVAGDHFAVRVGASLLRAIGLPDLVADNVDEFVDKAVTLGSDRHRLTAVKADLQARLPQTDVFRPAHFAAAVQHACRQVWQRWCDGLPPQDFHVGAV